MVVEVGEGYINLDNVTHVSYRERDGESYMDVRFAGGTSTALRGPEMVDMGQHLAHASIRALKSAYNIAA
jgi:hypothetical protein